MWCPECKVFTKHYVQDDERQELSGEDHINIRFSCIEHNQHLLSERKTVPRGLYTLLMADQLKPDVKKLAS